MFEHEVTIVADKELQGYEPHEDGEWIKQYIAKGEVTETIQALNLDLNITSRDMTNLDIDEDYATYSATIDGVSYDIEID